MLAALDLYRREFEPSDALAAPYALAGVSVVAAETDAAATRLFTSLQQQFIALHRGTPGQLPPPVGRIEEVPEPHEIAGAAQVLREAIVGSRATVRGGLEAFLRRTEVDEVMVTAQIFDHAARLRSYEILAEVRDAMAVEASPVALE